MSEIGLPADNLDSGRAAGYTASSWESDKISSHVAKVAGDVGETSLFVVDWLYKLVGRIKDVKNCLIL